MKFLINTTLYDTQISGKCAGHAMGYTKYYHFGVFLFLFGLYELLIPHAYINSNKNNKNLAQTQHKGEHFLWKMMNIIIAINWYWFPCRHSFWLAQWKSFTCRYLPQQNAEWDNAFLYFF